MGVVGLGAIDGRGAAAGALGLVHRRVGVHEHVGGVSGVAGEQADADAAADLELRSAHAERLAQLVEQHARGRLREGPPVAGHVGQHQHELVAAWAGEQVVAAHAGVEPGRERAQQVVAHRVAQ